MKILAFDTCFDACSAAVRLSPGAPAVAERRLMRRGHAEALMPMIDRVMGRAGLAFADLDRIAVTHGPGTFTGTRLGIAAALGFSVARGTPVATASSLAIVARSAAAVLAGHISGLEGIAVIRDARRQSVYLEITDPAGNPGDGPRLATLDEAAGVLSGRRLFAFGSGVAVLESHLGRSLTDVIDVVTAWPEPPAEEGADEPDARHLLDVATTLAVTHAPEPLYLRPPDATPAPPLPGFESLARSAAPDA